MRLSTGLSRYRDVFIIGLALIRVLLVSFWFTSGLFMMFFALLA